ncbi:MAG TPA: SLC13 family permease [Caldilineae bacterium]|nr:SLC13 family permease [Caldilineae bacterium]
MIEGLVVLAILIIALVAFATERVRVDLVALGIMVMLMALGIVSPAEGLSGFANPATITIASMFVLSAGLQRTNLPALAGTRIIRLADKSELRLMLLLMLTTGVLSAFILNTAVVAVFIPIALRIARELKIAPSRLLMPISFGAILGGTLTLIGTSTNLLVSSIAAQSGLTPFSFFEFAPFGIITLAAGLLYIATFGRKLLPDRPVEADLLEKYHVREYLSQIKVRSNSPLIGKKLGSLDLGKRFDITILDILRDGHTILLPGASRHIRAHDIILVRAPLDKLLKLQKIEGLEIVLPEELPRHLLEHRNDLGMAEVVVAPQASIIGFTIKELNFRQMFGVVAIGMLRRGMSLTGKFTHEPIMPGDMLLVVGEKKDLINLSNNPDFLLLVDVDAEPPLPSAQNNRAFWALAIMTGVVISAILGAPIVVSALAGAMLMVLTRVLTLDEAYASLDKRVLVLLAGILSLEAAMENSGLAEWLSRVMLQLLDPASPWLIVGAFYLFSMLLTETMSNQATAVVLAPVAISTAHMLGVDPIPLLMAITFAASASFMTPIGYQTNTMIYGTGNYRFLDFTRVGLPLNILLLILAAIFIPLIWPLY